MENRSLDTTRRRRTAFTSSAASLAWLVLLGLLASTWPARGALAFNLSPQGTTLERVTAQQLAPWYERWILGRIQGLVGHFSEPVHEEITHRIFDCDADGAYCARVDIDFAPAAVLFGVRWSDDLPFGLAAGQARNTSCKINESVRFISQPNCWRELFNDAEQGAAKGKVYDAASGAALLYRVHFGDLQFFHAMASRDGEATCETQRRITIWAEFAWRVALGEYGLATLLREVKVPGFNELMGRPDWRVQDLFTYGIDRVRSSIKQVAFGSLLHLMQDSFAKGHTDRLEPTYDAHCSGTGAETHLAPGRIREFHAYNNQDHKIHKTYDSRAELMAHIANTRPHVVTVGRTLRSYFEAGAKWEAVRAYVECIFETENGDKPASPGDGFAKDK